MRRRRAQAGVGLVEFALTVPVLLAVTFGMIDFGRAINADTTVADAARQGARQMAPSASGADSPFGTFVGSCSGRVLAQNATGTGCLTDSAVFSTVVSALGVLTGSATLYSATDAAHCPAPATAAQASVCISPGETAAATRGPGDGCAAAQTALGHAPAPGDLGGRRPEWTTPQYAAGHCFLVQVTVKYAFRPWTPVINGIVGSSLQLSSSTSTVAEY
jgi:Flp pilus assembly protein TadG